MEGIRLDPAFFPYSSEVSKWYTNRPFDTARFERLLNATRLPANPVGINFSVSAGLCRLSRPLLHSLVTAAAADDRSASLFHLDERSRRAACAAPRPSLLPLFMRSPADGVPSVDAPRHAEAAVAALREHGYVRVGTWGLDLRALSAQAAALLATLPVRPLLSVANGELPALKPLLEDPQLAAVLTAYLGGAVRFDGHVLLRLGEGLTDVQYKSSRWHHDRCGRRVKLFVFLHEVTLQSRPTLVARGTHDLWYYVHQNPAQATSRPSARFVTSHYRVAPMVGPGGGGFLFDTNTIHRGEHIGSAPRTVVILEFHAHEKLVHLQGLSAPCPSNPSPLNDGGEPGFALYPNEGGGKPNGGGGKPSGGGGKPSGGGGKLSGGGGKPSAATRPSAAALLRRGSACVKPTTDPALKCLFQKARAVCGGGAAASASLCVPIEPLPTEDWRFAVGKPSASKAAHDQGYARIEAHITYKPLHLLRFAQLHRRRVYIDLGANAYASSIGSWFLPRYPHARSFDEIIAFEANPRFNATYADHPEVELLNVAAWTHDGLVDFRRGRAGGGSGRVEAFPAKRFGAAAARSLERQPTKTVAIDLAAFLRRRVSHHDFVLLKMDVEGAEYALIPHLIEQRVTHLIDEMFVELHTEKNVCCRPPHDAGRHFRDAIKLVQTLRDDGVYVHPWG